MSLGRVTAAGQLIHGISMDIMNLKEAEAQAWTREAQQAAVAELGQRAPGGARFGELDESDRRIGWSVARGRIQ
jgi:hypothetical protein